MYDYTETNADSRKALSETTKEEREAKYKEINLTEENIQLKQIIQRLVDTYGEWYGDTYEIAYQQQPDIIKEALDLIK